LVTTDGQRKHFCNGRDRFEHKVEILFDYLFSKKNILLQMIWKKTTLINVELFSQTYFSSFPNVSNEKGNSFKTGEKRKASMCKENFIRKER